MAKEAKDNPSFKEALLEFCINPINFDKPEDITIQQQKVIGKIYQIFNQEIKKHLPNYNRQVPRFEEYQVISEELVKNNPTLEKFIMEYSKENQQKLEEEGRKIAGNQRIKRFEQQKQVTKQQFKTTAFDIGDKLDNLTKEQLGNIKAQKLARSNSIAGDKPTTSLSSSC
ncbi:MAG: hypothetical protein RCG15_04985 [Candidatus Rickettsia vulgarisii]